MTKCRLQPRGKKDRRPCDPRHKSEGWYGWDSLPMGTAEFWGEVDQADDGGVIVLGESNFYNEQPEVPVRSTAFVPFYKAVEKTAGEPVDQRDPSRLLEELPAELLKEEFPVYLINDPAFGRGIFIPMDKAFENMLYGEGWDDDEPDEKESQSTD